jgi:YesN/AraC family two-component response regulator
MNRQDLISLWQTLTANEKHYESNPHYQAPYYNKLEQVVTDDFGPAYVFSFENELKNLKDKGLNTKLPHTDQFLIVRQSRFSNILPHKHDFIEMNIVYSGNATVTIQNKEVKLKQGNVCILDTNVVHSIKALGKDDIVINFLMQKKYFNTAMLSRLSNNDIISKFLLRAISKKRKEAQYIVFENSHHELFLNLVENLLCEYYEPSFYVKEIIDAYMVLIFTELLKNYQKYETDAYRRSTKTYIGEIIQYIAEHYVHCSLKSVAQKFNLHPNYLSRYIKESTGYSYKELVQEQRINQACFLLLNTDLSIEEISLEIGYKNCDFFYQKFRQKFSTTPKKYRDFHKKS